MKNPDTPVNNVNTNHERSEFEESHRDNLQRIMIPGNQCE